ncbi:Ig-like domain-containing protein [Candidatus Woesebacteria bacterium]|nr:Ig-like domain-containing protein [Candidatus Woesebacteria bacterium]MCD8527225.1 Ig-like domain-containing protein [Candidatus Woesebacteria bacterium]MCD8546591.1 Ig-like domain-containing protein [Candidatus Woesebacteria bacterium]
MPASSFLSRWFGPKQRSPRGSLLQQRIPTLLGLGILVVGVVAGLSLVQSDTASNFLPRASEDAVPRQVRITNITDTSFTVSFLTDLSAPGYLKYGTDQNRINVQVRDDRDKLANAVGSYQSHHVTVQGLDPSTQYYFVLGTGERSEFDNNGAPFAVRTARAISSDSETRTAYGNVLNEVGNPAEGSIVYLSIEGASPLSALVKANGSWAVQLTDLRTADLSALYTYEPTDPVTVQVQGTQRNETVNVDTTVSALSPMTDITFGAENEAPIVVDEAETPPPSPTAVPDTTSTDDSGGAFGSMVDEQTETTTTTTVTTGPVEIELENNEQISTQRPEFLGTAPANGFVQIEVHSNQPIFDVATVDSTGNWAWTPPEDLEPGEHTITVTYTDDQGNQQKINRTFLVLANGESNLPAFTSSPSGTLATPTPTPTPVATSTPTPTPTPVASATPTASPRVSTPATHSAQPVSGSSDMTVFLVGVGLIFFAGGIFVTRQSMRSA